MAPTFVDQQLTPSLAGGSSSGAAVPSEFVDRRGATPTASGAPVERRQFANSHDELSPDARELARAIDQYKVVHRRRFITFEEMLGVMKSLGYHK